MKNKKRAFKRLCRDAMDRQSTGDVANAQHLWRKALKIFPSSGVYVNLGLMSYRRGYRRRAEVLYRQAVKLDPRCPIARNNLGVVLNDRGEYGEAFEQYRQALAIKPKYAAALANLSKIYCDHERYDEAMTCAMQALEIEPQNVIALTNAATVLWSQNQHDLAIATLNKAIDAGGDGKVHVNLGLALLATDQYFQGFREYSWRFSAYGVRMRAPASVPIWNGRDRVKGRLYVWPEQGLGDEILYAGSMAYAAASADFVTWECEQRLVPVLRRIAPPNVEVVPLTEHPIVPEGTIAQIPAGCLLQVDVPAEPRKGYLECDDRRAAAFAEHLPERKRIVGISWHSANPTYGHKKSLTLDDFKGFIDNPDCHCVSLQYGDHDHGPLNVMPGLDLTKDIDGVVALIACCDVVVTVSNTVAHLAGAVGVPCIVMVSDTGGKQWYWGTGTKTRWYESVTVQRFQRPSASEAEILAH